MRFQLDITLTDEDYFAYNYFHSVESPKAKKQLQHNQILLSCLALLVIALYVFVVGLDSYYSQLVVVLGAFLLIYALFLKKIIARNIKNVIKKHTESGKPPFAPVSQLTFEEDKLVETTPAKRVEESYDALECVYVLKDRHIFLYNSSMSAYILPIPQLQAQVNQQEFLDFLSTKCKNIVQCG